MPAATHTVTLDQLVALNDEIAALVRAGVPLELGLGELGGESGGALGEISTTLAGRMQTGQSLPEALRAEERRIPAVYRTVVEAGIRAGRLSAALEALSNFARELLELRRQIGVALIYPLIVFALAYGLFVVFTIDMVARFRETYEMFRIPMHGPLRWLAWLSDRVALWWWIPPAALVALIVWYRLSGRSEVMSFSGPSRLLGWVPGVGRIGRYFRYANFSELLALLVEQQVPLVDGLKLAAEATGDRALTRTIHEFAMTIKQGAPARQPDSRDFEMPPFLLWVLWQASRGANPVRLLRHAAAFYRRRAAGLANWFKVLFPMLSALVIGGGVTIVYALTLFGPMATFWRDLMIE